MIRIFLFVACLCLSLSVSAQSLSGVVKDKVSDEVLISATVKLVLENGSALFTTTDSVSYTHLTLPTNREV